MKFELNIQKKHFYILVTLVAIVIGIVGVRAFGTTNPTYFGHSASEIGMPDGSTLAEYVTSAVGGAASNSYGPITLDPINEGDNCYLFDGAQDPDDGPCMDEDGCIIRAIVREDDDSQVVWPSYVFLIIDPDQYGGAGGISADAGQQGLIDNFNGVSYDSTNVVVELEKDALSGSALEGIKVPTHIAIELADFAKISEFYTHLYAGLGGTKLSIAAAPGVAQLALDYFVAPVAAETGGSAAPLAIAAGPVPQVRNLE